MKKKLIAAILSVAMVASMVPATAFAGVQAATTKAVTQSDQTAVDQAVAAIKEAAGDPEVTGDTEVSYTEAYKTKLQKANTLYNGLDASGKASVGDALAARLARANELYKAYTDAIAEVDGAYAAVKTVKSGDKTNTSTVYGKANNLYSTAAVAAADAKVPSGSKSDATISAAALSNTDLIKYLSTDTTTKKTDADAASVVVEQIAGAKVTIDKDNYNAAQPAGKIKDIKIEYNKLSDAAQAMVGNYGAIVAMENNTAAFKKAVKDLTALNTAAYKAAVAGTIGTNDITVQAASQDTAAVKVAFNALAKDIRAAVTVANTEISASNITNAEDNIKAYQDKMTDEEQATLVIEKIRALKAPTSIGLSDKAAIEDARTSYDALSAVAVKIVKSEAGYENKFKINYEDTLLAAEKAYSGVVRGETDTVRVEKLTAMVSALPDPNSVTVSNEAAVLAAKAYFENNTSGAVITVATGAVTGTATTWQKLYAMGAADKEIALDTATAGYKKLVGCLQVLQTKTDAEATAAATYVKDYLDKLSVYTGTGSYIGTDATRLANAQTNMANAQTAFDKLDARVQTIVKKDPKYAYLQNTTNEIAKAQDGISEAAKISNVNTLIKAVKDAGLSNATDLTKDNLSKYEAKITAANTAYNQLSETAQAKVTDSAYMEAVAKKMKEIKDLNSISAIEDAISKVTMVKTDGTETESTLLAAQTQIKSAAAMFYGLEASVQEEISNAGRLAKAEKALYDAAAKLANVEFDKVGNITAGITASQITLFNNVVRIVTEFGLDPTTAITSTNPTYAQVEAAVIAKDSAAVNAVKTAIAALPTTVAKKDVGNVYYVQDLYNKLSETAKNQVLASELAKLKDAVKQADALSLTKATIAVEDQNYTGTELKPEIIVKDANGIVVDPAEYDVVYKDNVKVGTATVRIHALDSGKYVGEQTETFEIKDMASSLANATVTGLADKTYTGKAQTQKLTVKLNGKTLKSGTDYALKYTNSTNIGAAKVEVKAVEGSKYTGSVVKTFKINPAKATINSLQVAKAKLRVNTKKQSGGVKYQIHYKLTSAKTYSRLNTTSTSKVLPGIKARKQYTVKVRAYKIVDGKTYYGSYSSLKRATTK